VQKERYKHRQTNFCVSRVRLFFEFSLSLLLEYGRMPTKIKNQFIFYKNNFTRTRDTFCSKFKNKLRTIPASAEEESLKFSI